MSIDVYADGLICCLSSWLEAGHGADVAHRRGAIGSLTLAASASDPDMAAMDENRIERAMRLAEQGRLPPLTPEQRRVADKVFASAG